MFQVFIVISLLSFLYGNTFEMVPKVIITFKLKMLKETFVKP